MRRRQKRKAKGVCLGSTFPLDNWIVPSCIFSSLLDFPFWFMMFLRLQSSTEQDDVKEGVKITYCIIIREDQQIGSTSDCCVPKVGQGKLVKI